MAEPVDYFTNHRYKTRFPWSLYHGPIIRAVREVVSATPGSRMLNLGSGPFLELPEIGPDIPKDVTLCDIDPRAIELARRLHGARINRYDVTLPGEPLPYAAAAFDLVISMDVIEHVPEPRPWLVEALRILRPGGTLFLTTPNYASWSLRTLESTVLEVIAKTQGFSRKLLHPSKMTPRRLQALLDEVSRGHTELSTIAYGWVLSSTTKKPGETARDG